MAKFTVEELFRDKGKDLCLKLLAGEKGLNRQITVTEINRPGLTLTGYFKYFRYERIQIIGGGEHSYLQFLTKKKRIEILDKFFSYEPPCAIITRNVQPLRELITIAQRYYVPLFLTSLGTPPFITELIAYLEEKLAPLITMHGTLTNVYGLGVLILGESAIGKSETALELIKRGHMLVTDDVVEIRQKPGGVLIGSGKGIVSHHMEIRGLGIIDVRTLFGMGAILESTRIELVVHLEEWNESKEYERLGLEDNYTEILGVKIPELVIPVRPGRNIAVLIEVAAMNQRLKSKGYYSARELDKYLIKLMQKKQK
ncbi:MAG TPA: HPr kinase/phosphorylase [Elusimicrobia bacterium]|nr:HPr kinase/phosphorylase [Elusimicrobiota bacterium]